MDYAHPHGGQVLEQHSDSEEDDLAKILFGSDDEDSDREQPLPVDPAQTNTDQATWQQRRRGGLRVEDLLENDDEAVLQVEVVVAATPLRAMRFGGWLAATSLPLSLRKFDYVQLQSVSDCCSASSREGIVLGLPTCTTLDPTSSDSPELSKTTVMISHSLSVTAN